MSETSKTRLASLAIVGLPSLGVIVGVVILAGGAGRDPAREVGESAFEPPAELAEPGREPRTELTGPVGESSEPIWEAAPAEGTQRAAAPPPVPKGAADFEASPWEVAKWKEKAPWAAPDKVGSSPVSGRR